MKILQKAVTPDGIEIRLEDWNEDYAFYPYGSTIAAYPKKYMRRRAEANFPDHKQALSTFEDLQNGNTHVLDVDFSVMESGGNRVPFKPILERCMKRYNA